MSVVTLDTSTTVDSTSLDSLLEGLTYIDLRIRWAVARARAMGLSPDDEFRGLYVSDNQIDTLLGYEVGAYLWSSNRTNGTNGTHPTDDWQEWERVITQTRAKWQSRLEASHQKGIVVPFKRLCEAFHLTPIEEDILLIALAPELDPRYERFFAYLQDDVTKKRPSVDLALNLLTNSFREKLQLRHLLTDSSPLIQSRLLIRFTDGANREPTLLGQFLRPAPSVLEYLLGQVGIDTQLTSAAKLYLPGESFAPERAEPALIDHLKHSNRLINGRYPLFGFVGGYGVGKEEAAKCLAQEKQQPLLILDLVALSESELGLTEGTKVALRDGRLLQAILYLTSWDNQLQDGRPPDQLFNQLLDYPYTVIVVGTANWQASNNGTDRRPIFTAHFPTSGYERRLQIWEKHIGAENMTPLQIPQVANHFLFAPGQIEDVIATAHDMANWRQENVTTADLFAASRIHSNQKLSTLATKIQPRYKWDDIVLPSDTREQLREMINMVEQKPLVYEKWGFDRKLALGKGLNALFAGESGTGKTMAADIMAGQLGLDLYKIDLSMLVSKYIGETEKNLDKIFTEAATSNAILFFDEADSIFGKRSEVKDSHDRYANIEISYLLQRMEAYDGVVILATNLRANLDEAFTRRLHFAIEFPFPEPADRERIMRVNFPADTPLASNINFQKLAERFHLAGGNIRNIILAAAFLAAETGEPVNMSHLLHATRREYQKMGRLIDERLFKLP